VKGPAAALTIYLGKIPAKKATSAARGALHVSDLQAVERDFAFVVGDEVAAEDMIKAAKGADKALIAAASVFDVFGGEAAVKSLGEGKKSVALSVRIEPKDVTLTDKDIEGVSEKIIANVIKATKGELRS